MFDVVIWLAIVAATGAALVVGLVIGTVAVAIGVAAIAALGLHLEEVNARHRRGHADDGVLFVIITGAFMSWLLLAFMTTADPICVGCPEAATDQGSSP